MFVACSGPLADFIEYTIRGILVSAFTRLTVIAQSRRTVIMSKRTLLISRLQLTRWDWICSELPGLFTPISSQNERI